MSSDEKSGTTVTNSNPYGAKYTDYQQQEAKRIYQQGGPQYFPYSTVAPLNPYQTQAMGLASEGAAGRMDPVFENVRSKVMPAIDSAYSRGGRRPTGAGGYGAAAADALTNAYAPLAMQQYNTDYGRLYQAGQDYNQYQQANVQDAMNRWQYSQSLPWDQLARYQNAIQAGGGNSQTTSPYYQNNWLQGAGAGASLLGSFMSMYN